MYKVCTFFISYPKEYRKSMDGIMDTIITIIFYRIVSYYSIIIEKYILYTSFFFYFVLFLLFYE